MSRETDKKIAEWLGWKRLVLRNERYIWKVKGKNFYRPTPEFKTSDADAVSLLPVLVERGYDFKLRHSINGYRLVVIKVGGGHLGLYEFKPSISEAICAAVLQVIEREGRDEE